MKAFHVNGYQFDKGDKVSAQVEWKDGRRTCTEGTLITVKDDKAYVQTSVGAVEVDAETLEPA